MISAKHLFCKLRHTRDSTPYRVFAYNAPINFIFSGYLWCVVVTPVGHLENGLSNDKTCLQINMHWLLSCCLQYLSIPHHSNPSQSYLKTAFTLMFISPQSMTHTLNVSHSARHHWLQSLSHSLVVPPLSANPYA